MGVEDNLRHKGNLMGIYLTAKEYFIQQKQLGNCIAASLLDEYEEIKAQSGEFISAKYLADIYRQFVQEIQDVSNG
jgi:hypothetical protein